MSIASRKHNLWRTVDEDSNILDMIAQRRRLGGFTVRVLIVGRAMA